MHSPPKVTTIIPVFNRQRFIPATIESALAQDYSKNEVVVIDDGSTDCTPLVLESYRGRITILTHPGHENRGQSAAINLGIRSTHSKYLAILDSDDLCYPEKLKLQVEFLESHPGVGFVYANGYEIDASDRVRSKLFPHQHRPWTTPEEALLSCPIGCPSAFLFRRSLFDQVGFYDENLRSAQDHDMVIRLTEVARVGYMDKPLWLKREHADSLSLKFKRRRWETGFRILHKALRRYPYPPTVRRRRLAVLHYRLGHCFTEDGIYLTAARHFLLAGIYDPKRALITLATWDWTR